MSRNLAIVIPVRSLSGGKTRLGPDASPELRAAMTATMLRTVLAAAAGSGAAGDILLVSPDPAALALGESAAPSVVPVPQPPDRAGLNPAIDLGRESAIARGATSMLVLFADLPLIEPADVAAIAGTQAPVVLAPDRAGSGTNALMLDLTGPGRGFGEMERRAALAEPEDEAARLGLQAVAVRTPGATFDLDTPADLRELLDAAGDRSGLLALFPEAAP
ncbi:MAG: 2-phospho-L-lactate guanylyltransferase [Chloroflexota bacterium]